MLQPLLRVYPTHRKQFQQRLLKLVMVVTVTIISTMVVPPQATQASFHSPLGPTISVSTNLTDGQRQVTIEYSFSPRYGGLEVRFVHLGYDGWQQPQVITAVRTRYDLGGITYQALIDLPAYVRTIDFAFTDGTRWDNNYGADYHAVPAPWTPTWAGNLAPAQPQSVNVGTPVEITAQFFEPGVTDQLSGPNFNDDVIAELWYTTGDTWRALPMYFHKQVGHNHQYVVFFDTTTLQPGTTVRYTCRFSANAGATWRWCDLGNHGDGSLYIQ